MKATRIAAYGVFLLALSGALPLLAQTPNRAGKSAGEPVSLNPLTGALTLSVTPADAKVTIEPLSVPAREVKQKTLVVASADTRTLPVGSYRVRVRREGFETATREPVVIEAGKTAFLSLSLSRISPLPSPSATPTLPVSKGVSRLTAFGASLIVPGLGQHVQRRHKTGAFVELLAIGSAVAAGAATLDYHAKRDDFIRINDDFSYSDDRAASARATAEEAQTRARWAQMAAGAVWALNALDALRGAPHKAIALESSPNRVAVSFAFDTPRLR